MAENDPLHPSNEKNRGAADSVTTAEAGPDAPPVKRPPRPRKIKGSLAEHRERYLKSKRENPKRISKKLKHAIKLVVVNGLTQRAAAQKAGIREETLSRALKRPHVMRYRDELIISQIKELAGEGLGKLGDLIRNARSEKVRLEAIKDVLDRAGYGPERSSTGVAVQVNISLDDPHHEG